MPTPAAGPPAENGEVPDGVDERLVSLVRPASFEAEQYRALRHLIEQAHRRDGVTTIAVTSAAIGDGKTTTTLNLAGALAQARDARVLVIDADLRRPALDRALGLPATMGPGLVHAILDPAVTLDDVTHQCPPFNLSVIRAGQHVANPYEVLKSPRLGELLEEARHRYDFVLLDAPPLVPVQDCRVIGRWVGGFLVVVAAHRTPRRLVAEALDIIDPAKMLGLVFNGDGPLSGYYSGYYAGYSYSHLSGPNGHGDTAWRLAMKRLGGALGRRGPGRRRARQTRGVRR